MTNLQSTRSTKLRTRNQVRDSSHRLLRDDCRAALLRGTFSLSASNGERAWVRSRISLTIAQLPGRNDWLGHSRWRHPTSPCRRIPCVWY